MASEALLEVREEEKSCDEGIDVGSTDLARAWEGSTTVRRRAAVYCLVFCLHISVMCGFEVWALHGFLRNI